MADPGLSDADLEIRRRRARFRSWHRGLRELDLLLGRFADREVSGLSELELSLFEDLMEVPDADLLKWITGQESVPDRYNTPLFQKIAALRPSISN